MAPARLPGWAGWEFCLCCSLIRQLFILHRSLWGLKHFKLCLVQSPCSVNAVEGCYYCRYNKGKTQSGIMTCFALKRRGSLSRLASFSSFVTKMSFSSSSHFKSDGLPYPNFWKQVFATLPPKYHALKGSQYPIIRLHLGVFSTIWVFHIFCIYE